MNSDFYKIYNAAILRSTFFSKGAVEKLESYTGFEVLDEATHQDMLQKFDFVLTADHASRLCVTHFHHKSAEKIVVDFSVGKMEYRLQSGKKIARSESIAKAIGLTFRRGLHVLDTTAGFGRDAFILASLGCDVTLLEYNPIVFLLLEDGLFRGRRNKNISAYIERMKLFHGCSYAFLQKNGDEHLCDVAYIDPMFSRKNKNSLPHKEMQLLREIVDTNSTEKLLPCCLKKAYYRVVVKRYKKEEPLNGIPPNHQIKGKTCRFDVYTLRTIRAFNGKV